MIDRPRLLIVDDDVELCESVADALTDAGYDPVTAGDGARALALTHAEQPPQLILLDLMMPVLDGWQFLDARRSDPLLSSIPVVVVSATPAAFEGRGLQEQPEVNAVLSKPIALERLLSFVETFC